MLVIPIIKKKMMSFMNSPIYVLCNMQLLCSTQLACRFINKDLGAVNKGCSYITFTHFLVANQSKEGFASGAAVSVWRKAPHRTRIFVRSLDRNI